MLFRDKWSFLNICIMCDTPNRPLRNTPLIPTGTEEWLYLTARWWTWNTLNIENHLGGPSCEIFDHIFQSWCLSYRGDSQPGSEEHPVTPNRPLRNSVCKGRYSTLSIENHVWGLWCVTLGIIILYWYMHHVGYSQPATEEHPITPNRPLRNGCIWQHYGSRETHQTLKIISGDLDV